MLSHVCYYPNKTEGNKGIDLVAIGLHDFMSSQANVFNTERTPAGVWLGSVRNLAQLAGLPRPRVERAIKQLESADLIKHFPLAGQKTAFMVDGFEVAKFKYYETWWVAAAQTDNWESPSGVSVS